MKIEQIPINQLKPYANNPKVHPQAQIDAIAASIEAFGFQSPLLLDADNTLIAGHGRYLAAQQLGLKKVPCIRADDLTPEQARALRIADNKLQELSAWDWEALARDFTLNELAALSPQTGLTEDDLARFIDAAHIPLGPAEARAAVDQAAGPPDAPPPDPNSFEAAMSAPIEPKMAIVPQYCETYEAFIIVCQNSIDEAYMRNALDLYGLAQSYVDSKIRRANIITVETFKERWESR